MLFRQMLRSIPDCFFAAHVLEFLFSYIAKATFNPETVIYYSMCTSCIIRQLYANNVIQARYIRTAKCHTPPSA